MQESKVNGCGKYDYPHIEWDDPRCLCPFPAAGSAQDLLNARVTWWGENLQGALSSPVKVVDESGREVHGKLVYSPHTYGPSVFDQPVFSADNFPANMPAIWDIQYGMLRAAGQAVVVGEWGGKLRGSDAVWQDRFSTYLAASGIGSFYWSLNPESADTGGLYTEWGVADAAKLDLTAKLRTTKVPASHRGERRI